MINKGSSQKYFGFGFLFHLLTVHFIEVDFKEKVSSVHRQCVRLKKVSALQRLIYKDFLAKPFVHRLSVHLREVSALWDIGFKEVSLYFSVGQ